MDASLSSLLALSSISMAGIHGALMGCRIVSMNTGCVGMILHMVYMIISHDIVVTTRLWLGVASGASTPSQKRVIPEN